MKWQTMIAMLALGIGLGIQAGQVQAQNYGRSRRQSRGRILPFDRPAISPYQQLLRRDGNFTNNYFQRFRPEMEFRRSTLRNRRSIGQLRSEAGAFRSETTGAIQQLQQAPSSGLSTTGHPTTFLDLSGYFGGR